MSVDRRPHADDQLRAGFAALSRDAAFTPACPAADRLWAGARGELAPADVEAMAVHMADCGACAEAWRIARDFGTPAELAAPAHAFQWWMPAAAVIVLASGVSLFYLTRPTAITVTPTTAVVAPAQPSFTIELEKAPVKVSSKYALTFRGPGDGRKFLEALKIALEPYERNDYPAAAASLGALRAQYPDAVEPSLYQGVSLLLSGHAASAIEPLQHARDRADADHLDDATWFLAAASERAGRRDEAQRLAQAVCNGRGQRATSACSAAAALRQP
jgi:hypothetical protein